MDANAAGSGQGKDVINHEANAGIQERSIYRVIQRREDRRFVIDGVPRLYSGDRGGDLMVLLCQRLAVSLPLMAILLAAPQVGAGAKVEVAGRVVALNFTANDVSETLASTLSELMVGTLRDATEGRATVIGQSEIEAMLAFEQTQQMVGCTDASCLAELGGALGANHLVNGKIGRIGSVYLLSLKLIDTKHARVQRHLSERISGSDEALIGKVVEMTHMLVGTKPPHSRPMGSALTATAPMETTQTVSDEGGSIFTKWWFWTIVAGAAAGGAVFALTSGGDGGTNGEGTGSVSVEFTP